MRSIVLHRRRHVRKTSLTLTRVSAESESQGVAAALGNPVRVVLFLAGGRAFDLALVQVAGQEGLVEFLAVEKGR